MQKENKGTQKRDEVIRHTKHRHTTEEIKEGGKMCEQKEEKEEE